MDVVTPPRPISESRYARKRRSARRVVPVVPLALCLIAAGILVIGVALARPDAVPVRRAGGAAAAQAAPPAAPPPVVPKVPSRPRHTPASSAELPGGGPIPKNGNGTWHVVPGTSGVSGKGPVTTYTVEVEDGVTPPGGDAVFAAAVQATLADPRSWIGGGDVAVRRVDGGRADLHVRLSSQKTARAECGFEIPVDVSCRHGDHVYLNSARWVRGAVAFHGDLAGYRQYMVNHEVGHFFGHQHKACKKSGGPAPVMMQQTFSTSNNEIADITAAVPQGVTIPRNGKVCTANPWPFP